MKKILSFVMVVAMALSLSAFAPMTTKKVAHKAMPRIEQKAPVAPASQSARLATPQARKAMATATALQTKKQQPQVKHVAKKHVVRKAGIKKAAMETTATFMFASSSDVNQTVSNVTLAIEKAGGQSDPAWNDNSKQLRIYEKNTITISGSGITKIELTCGKTKADKAYASLTANTGSLVSGGESTAVGDSKTDTWTGSANEVVFTVGKGQRAVEKIVVTVGGEVPPTPPTPSGDVTITGLNYADAVFYEDETYGDYWSFDFYKELDEEGYILSPYVYFMCEESTTSGTKIAGTWTAYDAGYFATDDEESGIYTDEEVPVGTLTVTCVSQGVYNFVGSFVGEDGKTYTWTLNNMTVDAYNGDTYEEITLTDGGEPVPPTPGDIYTIAEVKSLHAEGAIKNDDVISVKGYVAGMFLKPSNFGKFGSVCVWLTDTKGGSAKELELYNCYGLNEDKFTSFSPDATGDKNVDVTSVSTATYSLNVGDYVEATGAFNLFNTTYELNTGCYLTKIGGTPTPPTPSEKYEVDMNADFEVSVEDFLGWFTIVDATVTASNDSIDFTAMVYSFEKEAFYGVEWSGEELECEFVLNGVEQTITSATLLATQEGDVTKATVVLVTASGAQYTLNLTYVVPEPKETVNVDYPQGVMGEYYPSTNDYYFYAENEGENIMSLDIFTSNLEGTYTMDDMDMYYTSFAKVNGTDTTWVAPYSIDATITNVEDTFRIAVDFFGKDTINYHITSWYVAPAAKDTITLNYANALYEDALEAYESAMVYGENANDFIQLYFAEIAQVAGDFTLADLYADYSYIGLVNGTDTTYVAFTSAEINVAVNGEVATITAGLMGTDTMYYKVTMTATIEKYEEDMYQYDEEEDVKDSFNAQTDQLTWDTSYFAEYGVVFLSVVKADESANIILEFVSDVATIANGTYPIAVDGDGTFVVASAGYDEAEDYDYPSYYAQYDDQYMYPWYIVSGTVTVSDEAIVVAGVNSKDKKVDITITLNQPTGDPIIISDDYLRMNDSVKKFMYKGNVMINVNGVIYNVMGAKVAR